MKYSIAVLFVILLASCGASKRLPFEDVKLPDVTNVDAKIKTAVVAKDAALKSGDKLKTLEAERNELRARLDKAKEEQAQYENQLKRNDRAISQERLDIAQSRAYWIAGVSTFLGGIAIAASLFVAVPLIRRIIRWAAFVFGAMALLALLFAWLVPYIVPIVCAMAVLAVIGAIVQWRTDHRGLNQLVEAVEPIKRRVEGAGDDLRDALSTDVKARVKGIRDRLGLRIQDDSGHG